MSSQVWLLFVNLYCCSGDSLRHCPRVTQCGFQVVKMQLSGMESGSAFWTSACCVLLGIISLCSVSKGFVSSTAWYIGQGLQDIGQGLQDIGQGLHPLVVDWAQNTANSRASVLCTGQTTVNKRVPIRYIIPINDLVHRLF